MSCAAIVPDISRKACTKVVGLTFLLVLSATVALSPSVTRRLAVGPRSAAAQSPAALALPFDPGAAFYICQGYHGEYFPKDGPPIPLSHWDGVDRYGFDLSLNPPGPSACVPSNQSFGSNVHSPVAGSVVQVFAGILGVCIESSDLDVKLAHIELFKSQGDPVSADEIIGTIAKADDENDQVAHLHISIYKKGTHCQTRLDFARGFVTADGVVQFPADGSINQYRGRLLKRAPNPPKPPQCRSADVNGSGRVDIFDLEQVISAYNKHGTLVSDLNCDSVVDIYDLSIMLSKWGTSG